VQTLAGDAALSPDIVAEIVERADGIPLFVEELTKAVLESALRGDQVAALLAMTSPIALSVPVTLHASLMARLDRLGPAAKEVAQIGAVLGREFAYELIEPVAQRPANELQAALGRLSDAGLLSCRGTAPHVSYLFKHALVQDTAYSTLLRDRRQMLHARVATALETHFPDLLERQPELLAYHLTAAGNTERAVDQWLKAGQYATAHLAHLEAVRHFERGLATLTALAAGAARDRLEIELQLALDSRCLRRKAMVRPGMPPPMAAPANSLNSGTTHTRCSCQSMASGNRPTAPARSLMPRFIDPASATDRGQGGRRGPPSGAPQRLGNLHLCRRVGWSA
jgi:predicted ATPase